MSAPLGFASQMMHVEQSANRQVLKMEMDEPIMSCYKILCNRELSSAEKTNQLDRNNNFLLIKNYLQLGVEVPEQSRPKLLELLIFIFIKGCLKNQLLSNALEICKRFTRLHVVAEKQQQQRLLARMYNIFGRCIVKPYQSDCLYQMTCISEIMQNLVVRNGNDSDLLADVEQMNSIFAMCLRGLTTIQCHTIAPKLIKTCLLCWPKSYQSRDELAEPGSPEQLTAGEAVLKANGQDLDPADAQDARRNCLARFLRVSVETMEDPNFKDVSSARTLLYGLVAGLAIDHELVFDVIDEYSARMGQNLDDLTGIPPSPEELIKGYLVSWFRDMRKNQFPDIDDVIISCRALIRIVGLESSRRVHFFEQFADRILACLIKSLAILEDRYKRLFSPVSEELQRLEPQDRMISEVLYRFLTIENQDQAWRERLVEPLRSRQRRALVNLLHFACSKKICINTSTGDSLEFKPSDAKQGAFWSNFLTSAQEKHNLLQFAHIKFRLKADKTVQRVNSLDPSINRNDHGGHRFDR